MRYLVSLAVAVTALLGLALAVAATDGAGMTHDAPTASSASCSYKVAC